MLRFLILVLIISFSFQLIDKLVEQQREENQREPKSIVLSSVKTKGIVLEKENRTNRNGGGQGHFLTIQTKADIVKTKVSEHVYKNVFENDTIK